MATVDVAMRDDAVGTRRWVVLKRVRSDRDTGDGSLALTSEARLSARLAHPNVVRTLDFEEEGGDVTLVLEYVPGVTLAQLQRRLIGGGERVPRAIALRIVRDLLDGLGYVHDARDYDGAPLGVVHRDVSPSNVLLAESGDVKLIDFGVARWAAASVHTSTGWVKGKIGYMAPEQLTGAEVDRRTDLFAVGIILWELLAGARIAGSERCGAWMQARLSGEVPRLRDRAPDVPEALEWVVRRCLARDPADRYPTARALREALDGLASAYREEARAADVRALVADRFAPELAARAAELEERAASSTERTSLPSLARPSLPALPSLEAPSSPPPRGAPDREETVTVPRAPRLPRRAPPPPLAAPPGRPAAWIPRVAVAASIGCALSAAALTTAVVAGRPASAASPEGAAASPPAAHAARWLPHGKGPAPSR